MMSTPTVLVGYYHGLLLRDINVDQLCNKLCSSGLLTTHDQHLISTGYSVYQKKYLLLETVRHMDEKSLLVACGVLYELWPEIGAQLNAGMYAKHCTSVRHQKVTHYVRSCSYHFYIKYINL